jgi:hypothetical protein
MESSRQVLLLLLAAKVGHYGSRSSDGGGDGGLRDQCRTQLESFGWWSLRYKKKKKKKRGTRERETCTTTTLVRHDLAKLPSFLT